MNKFDITELPKQWLVALVALAFTFLLVVPGCAGEAADNGGNGENAAEQAAQVAEEEGPIEAGQAAEDIVVPVSITMPESAGAEPKTIERQKDRPRQMKDVFLASFPSFSTWPVCSGSTDDIQAV